MLSPQERKELFTQLDELNKEVRALRATLNQLNDQKEALFSKRESSGKEISGLIRQVRSLRSERNKLTTDVKAAKVERKSLNDVINKKIDEIKKFDKEKKDTVKKHGMTEDPSKIKHEMERINYTIETSGLTFEKEQKLMKILKDLKRKYDEAKKISSIWDSSHALSTEIDGMKEKADAVHRAIQQKAQLSQEKHETMIDSSKKIDELKKAEDEMSKSIIEKKKEMEETSKKLEEKLKLLAETSDKLQVEKKETRQEKEAQTKKLLSDRIKDAEEKFRRGEKLTTEDILAMQGAEE
jgi:uncharacterized coiled-coil DUF342 family protein